MEDTVAEDSEEIDSLPSLDRPLVGESARGLNLEK